MESVAVGTDVIGPSAVDDARYAAEIGLIISQSFVWSIIHSGLRLFPPPCEYEIEPLLSIYASHRTGFLLKSTRTGREGGDGGTHVPFRIASSIIRRCRRLRMKERMTIAAETDKRSTSVARKV